MLGGDLWPKNPPMTQNDYSRQKIHKCLFSGGYEGGKQGNLKILQVFNAKS